MQSNVKEILKEHSGIIKQFIDVGYSQAEAEFMFELYFSKIDKFMTPEQQKVYSDTISSDLYKSFVETKTHLAAASAYDEFLYEALLQENQQKDMKFDA